LGDSDEMWVSQAVVNCGPIYKRFRARSMGRANSIQKRTSHITIAVAAPGAAVNS
jgi:large subunit ribosomal protein L22